MKLDPGLRRDDKFGGAKETLVNLHATDLIDHGLVDLAVALLGVLLVLPAALLRSSEQ